MFLYACQGVVRILWLVFGIHLIFYKDKKAKQFYIPVHYIGDQALAHIAVHIELQGFIQFEQ